MFTAKDVMELRELTGAGMMDCKKALTECEGDKEKAKDFLREKGLAAAAKKAGRIAAEGIVGSFIEGYVGTLIEVNCETDFVAKTDDFINFVNALAAQVAKTNPKDVEALMGQELADNKGVTVDQRLNETVAKIGEKISVRRFERYEVGADAGLIDSYIHLGGRIGVLVEASCPASAATSDEMKALLHDIALQIAAAKPMYIEKTEVPQDEIEKEKSILRAQALAEDKPKPLEIIEKMVVGRIEKYYKEVCLLEQVYVKDQDKNVGKVLSEASAKLGGQIGIKRFARFEMGEGLQKREDNFAEEVMSQMK